MLGLLSLGLGKRLGTVPKPHVPRLAAGPLGARGSWRRWDGEERPGQEMLRGRGAVGKFGRSRLRRSGLAAGHRRVLAAGNLPFEPSFRRFSPEKKKKKNF